MPEVDVARMAERLDEAARQARATPQISHEVAFGLEDAYAIQKASIARRLAARRAAGRHEDGLHQPRQDGADGPHRNDLGRLTDAMLCEDGGAVRFRALHPSAGRAGDRVPVAKERYPAA